jgi:hypothetical protein
MDPKILILAKTVEAMKALNPKLGRDPLPDSGVRKALEEIWIILGPYASEPSVQRALALLGEFLNPPVRLAWVRVDGDPNSLRFEYIACIAGIYIRLRPATVMGGWSISFGTDREKMEVVGRGDSLRLAKQEATRLVIEKVKAET